MGGRVVAKHSKYDPLISLAAIHHLQNRGPKPPRLFAAVASHSGELAPDFIHLIEWMSKHFRRHVTRGSAGYNGLPPARRVALYRSRLKGAIQARVAISSATLMCGAGTFSSRLASTARVGG